MDLPWRIELLGWLRAVHRERVITRFRSQQTGLLLAYLAIYPHRSHPRLELVERLWPEGDPEAGSLKLRVALSSLRRQLEPPGVPPHSVLLADRGSIQLNPAAVATDLSEFETALEGAGRHSPGHSRPDAGTSSSAARVQHLIEAVELYRGELLPGHTADWVLLERQRLTEAYLQALRQLVAELEVQGEVQRAIQYARLALGADSLREEAHHDLMRLLVAAGQPEAALRQYQELERLLARELGTVPEADARALVHTLGKRAVRADSGSATSGNGSSEVTEGRAGRERRASILAPTSPRSAPGAGTLTLLLVEVMSAAPQRGGRGEAHGSAPESSRTLCQSVVSHQGGRLLRQTGDSFLACFPRAADALRAVRAVQQAVAGPRRLPDTDPPLLRMALHTADLEPRAELSHDPSFHHLTRLLLAAHPGQVLVSEATAALVRANLEPGLQLVDRGRYRLRAGVSPEQVFQIHGAGMGPGDFSPLQAPSATTGHLRLPLDRFFGREQEIARLRQMLLAPDLEDARPRRPDSRGGRRPPGTFRLVTLTGTGGTGKTRLAQEFAARMSEEFHAAVWFVPLADLSDPGSIPHRVLNALHVQPIPGLEPIEQAVTVLARQPSLVVLDNFEHLAAQGAGMVCALLERAPTLQCLVTSRRRLNLPGEREFPLTPLPIPWRGASPKELLRCPSVQLFVDRAQAIRPDFQVTQSNAAAVAELCTRLEGLPLALQLAASRIQMLTPAQMLPRLEQRLQFLTSLQRRHDARHASLRAALDWSYELLSPELQRLLACLSVFHGGFTLEAVAAVCGEEHPHSHACLDGMDQLCAGSLVVADDTGEEVRYRLLETVREHAGEKLRERGESVSVRSRHRKYFLGVAERAEPEFYGPAQKEWLERLEGESANLKAALEWAMEQGDAAAQLRMAGVLPWFLAWFWWGRGHAEEGRRWLERIVAISREIAPGREQDVPEALRARALHGAGLLAQADHNWSLARDLYEESLAIRRRLGDQKGIADTLDELARSCNDLGNAATARSLLEESLKIRRDLADERGRASTLSSLGALLRSQDEYEAAQPVLEECLSIYQRLDHHWGIGGILNELGLIAWYQGEYATARGRLEESLAVARAVEGEGGFVGSELGNLGLVAQDMGDYATARRLHEESLAIMRRIGARYATAYALNDLGNVALAEGDRSTARRLHQESLEIRQSLGDKRGVAASWYHMGRLALYEGALGEAARLFRDSLGLYREAGGKRGVAGCLEGLAKVAAARDRATCAARLFGAADALRASIKAPLPPSSRPEHDRWLTRLRERLGEPQFAAAWEAGRALSFEDASAEAVDEIETSDPA